MCLGNFNEIFFKKKNSPKTERSSNSVGVNHHCGVKGLWMSGCVVPSLRRIPHSSSRTSFPRVNRIWSGFSVSTEEYREIHGQEIPISWKSQKKSGKKVKKGQRKNVK